jgi:hypothetical protein
MKILCEMLISDLFRLSSGHVAIVGKLFPDIENFIPNNSKADLYVAGEKIKTINILGEDRFSNVDETKRQGRRSVRTDTEIPKELDASSEAKLIIFS